MQENNNGIKSLSLDQLQAVCKEHQFPTYRAKQVFDWLHRHKVTDYQQMTNLPKELIDFLTATYPLRPLVLEQIQQDSTDGTAKLLFRLADDQMIETVVMKYQYGYSICISSQVGCRMGCHFCASTQSGLARNLTVDEMLDQIYFVEHRYQQPIHSVVVMGIGEPFDNYENFRGFAELISDPNGRNLSRRNITVSTCGLVPEIERLAIDLPQVNLAISLHFSDNHKRSEIMPINKKYPIEQLLNSVKNYIIRTNRRVTFEYGLIDQVNDSQAESRELARRLDGILCHVNLIPINPVAGRSYRPSRRAIAFKKNLEKQGIPTTIRRSLGQQIEAACGQLRNRAEQSRE